MSFVREGLNLRIAGWAQALGLGGWEIAYSPKPPDGGGKRGSCDIDARLREAVIRLDPNIPASQVDRVLVHELGHILCSDMEDTFDRAVGELAPEAARFLRGDWERAEEWVLERLASVITGTTREAWVTAQEPADDGEPWLSGFPVADLLDEPCDCPYCAGA